MSYETINTELASLALIEATKMEYGNGLNAVLVAADTYYRFLTGTLNEDDKKVIAANR